MFEYQTTDSFGKTTAEPRVFASTIVHEFEGEKYVHVFRDIENVTTKQGLTGTNAGIPQSLSSDIYTVSQLYKAVKKIPRKNGGLKYSESEKNNYVFTYTEKNDGVKYQERRTPHTDRLILRQAAEQADRTGFTKGESSTLDIVLRRVSEIEENETKLNSLKAIENPDVRDKNRIKILEDKRPHPSSAASRASASSREA